MARLLVFYHSRTGNTQKMAEAVAEGARSVQGVEVELKTDMDVNPEDLGKAEEPPGRDSFEEGGDEGQVGSMLRILWLER
jgi:sulfite reductase alpha subunit-like flavoprotein